MRAVPLTLDADELRRLTNLAEALEPSGRAYRPKVILLAAQGIRNVAIAAQLGLSTATVGKWRNRYATYGIAGLSDEPRPGAPRTVDRSEVITTTLLSPPPELGCTHWSSRRLAAHLGIGDASVARVWREYGIAPRRNAEFSFATRPEIIASAVEVIGVLLAGSVKVVALTEPASPVGEPASQPEQPDSDDALLLADVPARPAGEWTTPTGRVAETVRDFVERARSSFDDQPLQLQDRPLRLVIDRSSRELAPLSELAAADPRLVLHYVEEPARWVNLTEIWCRLSGRSCVSAQVRAWADTSEPRAWLTTSKVTSSV